eukprot:TRINITY_DN2169_c0_g1_i3.p1 TRINITY_DN2169_c0_g1~~TRINITY_DN2169_c0_g1_i3.p1  ORF type:complete len:198 (+),score=18.25 TRINITY_DN2169_c0_g1_i3:871-1464(+)
MKICSLIWLGISIKEGAFYSDPHQPFCGTTKDRQRKKWLEESCLYDWILLSYNSSIIAGLFLVGKALPAMPNLCLPNCKNGFDRSLEDELQCHKGKVNVVFWLFLFIFLFILFAISSVGTIISCKFLEKILRILLNYIFHCSWYAWVEGFLNFSTRNEVGKKSSKKERVRRMHENNPSFEQGHLDQDPLAQLLIREH